jgi:hypothetical protein
MADPTGESKGEALRLDFDRRLMLRFCGSVITSDGGLPAYRELDDTVCLTEMGADVLVDARLGGLLRQSVFGRLAGYEDVNDAERLCHDPALCYRGTVKRLYSPFRGAGSISVPLGAAATMTSSGSTAWASSADQGPPSPGSI